ncbi:hypothetical protein GH741_05270 [Aquibacillus halophilus]|uniref:Uncharacterized protein n=1 Tax=Aquibacillus halophilus TaxID=930132 RepID=A0A6A8D905_9BACI|nr:hypothetical protein [Aquibacillus halophilus]MRH42084.1 hypothetical protein [Aquibacillus halophilus]
MTMVHFIGCIHSDTNNSIKKKSTSICSLSEVKEFPEILHWYFLGVATFKNRRNYFSLLLAIILATRYYLEKSSMGGGGKSKVQLSGAITRFTN